MIPCDIFLSDEILKIANDISIIRVECKYSETSN